MNIELMKQLEDRKKILATLNSRLDEEIDAKISQYFKSIRNDFSAFFKEKGFQINTENLGITATYGNLVARLTHDEPGTNYAGCYFAFTLDLKKLNSNEYFFLLNRKKPGFNVSVSVGKGTDMQKEFESLQKSIDEKQERIDHFSQEEWKLFLKDSNSTYSEGYSSIREFLGSIIE